MCHIFVNQHQHIDDKFFRNTLQQSKLRPLSNSLPGCLNCSSGCQDYLLAVETACLVILWKFATIYCTFRYLDLPAGCVHNLFRCLKILSGYLDCMFWCLKIFLSGCIKHAWVLQVCLGVFVVDLTVRTIFIDNGTFCPLIQTVFLVL